MASSSSDSEPNLADFLNRHQPEGSQDSDLPAWIQAHTPAKVPLAVSDDSDDAAAQKDDGADDAAGPSKRAGSSRAAAAASKPAAGKSKAAVGNAKQQAAAAAAAAAAGGTSTAKQGAAVAGTLPAVAVLSTAVGEGAAAQIPLVLPEKLIRHKVLVELEPAPHQATELSGDAGAVGRIIVDPEAAADGCFKVDLKGVLYQATVLPLAGTALVANIGPTEAKVESVVSDFVRLREESSYLEMGMLLEGGTGLNDLMADDEDNYQMGEDGKEAAGGKAAAKKAAVAKRKPSAKAGVGKGLKAAGGVRKKAGGGKKAGAGKGSRTPSKAKKPKAAAAGAGRGKAAGAKTSTKAGGKAAAAAAGKAKPAAKKKKAKQDSESEADTDSDSGGGNGGDSDWSMD